MTLKEMQRTLSLPRIPAAFPAIYEKMADSWETRAEQILSADFISQTLSNCYALAPYRSEILRGAQAIRTQPALCLLVCLLEAWLRDGGDPAWPEYAPPTGEGVGYDLLHLYPAIPTMPDSVAFLRNRNVPEDVIAGTMQEYDRCIADGVYRDGRPTMTVRLLSWMRTVIENRLINIGRLNYDIPGHYFEHVRIFCKGDETVVLADNLTLHRSGRILGAAGCDDPVGSFVAAITETETAVTGHPVVKGLVERETVTLSKAQWTQVLCDQDLVPRIHIPRQGSFDAETVQRSIDRARAVFATCYPDYPFKAIFCESWLLSEDLRDMLKPDSKILDFQNRFIKVPLKSEGADVFDFAFPLPIGYRDYPNLPEDTSLQRAIKAHYLAGNYLHEGAGFFY
ncbi:MAG: hypothetical protein IKB80_01460 [Oscillospiraceae bacterium]|nr:hypothetical protein [Oscillospiraceae bacterium]